MTEFRLLWIVVLTFLCINVSVGARKRTSGNSRDFKNTHATSHTPSLSPLSLFLSFFFSALCTKLVDPSWNEISPGNSWDY